MIEERIVRRNDKEQIGTLEHFLWKKNEDDERSSKTKILFQRDTEIPYYNEITKYEIQYQKLQEELYPVYKLHTILFVFLTLMLIIPGLVYKNTVNNHNVKIEDHNNIIYEKMEEILDKASRYTK